MQAKPSLGRLTSGASVKMAALKFEAKIVTTANLDGEFLVVGFADQEAGAEVYLVLQRGLDFDEQDVAHGMDTYHVEWCGQEHSRYGGISKFSLQSNHADIRFAPDAVQAFGGMDALTIFFQLTASKHLELRQTLEHIFEGTGCLVVADA
ncbi:Imm10 family immunity protein [Xanthomonas arboricola]|uniref:Imm10 family immunity protein n=1 Tax=Xanthomonas arboricola TaxID=56448 RepID=UPI001EE91520|nr:Imm10 family immunity protein [Xanthomonas arboricola]